jgi:hypothetical protein
MVSFKEPTEYEKLDQIIHHILDQHELTLYVDGWSRKTYKIYDEEKQSRQKTLLIQIESLVTSNGEILYYQDEAIELCNVIGEAIEKAFEVEVSLLKKQSE